MVSLAQLDLSEYVGQRVRLRFHDPNSSYGGSNWGWHIDDVRVLDSGATRVDHCLLIGPADACANPGETTPQYTASVLEPGITPGPGQGAGIIVEFGFGADGSIPSNPDWQWTEAEYLGDDGDRDIYGAVLVAAALGEFDVAARFRLEQWTTWTYADLDGNDFGSGGTNGYSVSQSASLSISGAELTLAPPSFAWSLVAGTAIEDTLHVGNEGTGELIFEIFESESRCSPGSDCPRYDLPWISVTPAAGTVAPGTVGEAVVTVQTAGLAAGTYTGYLVVWSNDCHGNPAVIPLALEVTTTTDVDPAAKPLPRVTRLYGNLPNPFNPTTTIRFDLHVVAEVTLSVYDLNGRLVRVLQHGAMPAGSHSVIWDGRNDKGATVPSGIYLCRMRAGAHEGLIKLTMLK
jgi:hypothetical protein